MIYSLAIADIGKAGVYWLLQLILLVLSFIALFAFAVFTALEPSDASLTWKRRSLLCEYSGLLYYIIALSCERLQVLCVPER